MVVCYIYISDYLLLKSLCGDSGTRNESFSSACREPLYIYHSYTDRGLPNRPIPPLL